MRPPRRAAAAAHSPETAGAGLEILMDGGTAADAAVAMTLTACAVEPFVVSLLSGMHSIHVDHLGRTESIDGFVDVPGTPTGGRTVETTVHFGGASIPYTIGGATFGTPGLVAGCAELHRRHGRLPWSRVVQPAVAASRRGFVLTKQDESLLEMIGPVMRLGEGERIFCIDGRLKQRGEHISIPEIAEVLSAIAEDGADTLHHGDLASQLATFCEEVGACVTRSDLAAMTANVSTPPATRLNGWTVRSRRGMSPLMDWVARMERIRGAHPAVRLARAQSHEVPRANGTTSLAVADAEGRAVAVTASLGLGTGDWFHGCQLNSMLGESDLLPGGLHPRRRMGSMMAPTALVGPGGAVTVLGSAGGSRIPSALVATMQGLVSGDDARTAVDRPRVHRIGAVAHVEPHLSEAGAEALVADGFSVQRWSSQHHFFGGVSVAGAAGAQGDPRRGGMGLVVE